MEPNSSDGIPADLAALQAAMAQLSRLAGSRDTGVDRLRRMETALRDLRAGVVRLNLMLQQSKATGQTDGLPTVLTPSVATAVMDLGSLLTQLGAELKARRNRLAALMQVTRQRAQVELGYRPLRGGRMALVQRQVRHCVQIKA